MGVLRRGNLLGKAWFAVTIWRDVASLRNDGEIEKILFMRRVSQFATTTLNLLFVLPE